jgi:hypothetical protein
LCQTECGDCPPCLKQNLLSPFRTESFDRVIHHVWLQNEKLKDSMAMCGKEGIHDEPDIIPTQPATCLVKICNRLAVFEVLYVLTRILSNVFYIGAGIQAKPLEPSFQNCSPHMVLGWAFTKLLAFIKPCSLRTCLLLGSIKVDLGRRIVVRLIGRQFGQLRL